MALPLPLYPGMANSPPTELTSAISAAATTIPVANIGVFPTPPCLATIGVEPDAETVRIASISGNNLSVQRAFQGAAQAWPGGTPIARTWTEYDDRSLKEGLKAVDGVSEAAVQTATVGGVPVVKSGTELQFDAYPSVPDWALQANKPTYNTTEIVGLQSALNTKSDKPKTIKNHPFLQANWQQQADERWRYAITESTPKLFIAGWDPEIGGYAPLNMGEITGGSQLLPENMENGTLYVWCANQPTADFTANIRMTPSTEEVIS